MNDIKNIITATPFRLSFFGGGTDLPDYFNLREGSILGTTINKYNYISVNSLKRLFEKKIRFSYSKLEEVNNIDDLNDRFLKAILKSDMNFSNNNFLDIHTYSDLPSSSGLGSSSAFVVGMLNALYSLNGIYKSSKFLSKRAISIEREGLALKGGWQDQILVAYGGFKKIDFFQNSFDISTINISPQKIKALEDSIILLYTNIQRNSSKIQESVFNKNFKSKVTILNHIKDFVDEGIEILNTINDRDLMIKEFGLLLNESWKMKKSLSKLITSSFIDDLYNSALEAGAYGGKLIGAGGGGFFMMIAPQNKRSSVLEKLKSLKQIDIKFSHTGSKVIFSN